MAPQCIGMGRRQATSTVVFAWMPCIFLSVLGGALFVAPVGVIQFLFSCFEEDGGNGISALDILLSRLAGGVMAAQMVSCVALLYPITMATICKEINNNQRYQVAPSLSLSVTSLDKCRLAVASLSMLGLSLVLIGLLDDRTNRNCEALQSSYVIASGAFVLVLACASMMISFWPSSSDPATGNANENSPGERTTTTDHATGNSQRQLTVPLLSSSRTGDDEETDGGNDELNDSPAVPDTNVITRMEQGAGTPTRTINGSGEDNHQHGSTEEEEEEEDQTPPTSRIRGTQRLLKLAAPQVFYLYIGCAILLVRLPFSLSIPHFVSTALGAVARGDFDGARTEVLLLFILGSIDAALDFWCIFLFGYANQKIVRSVRIDAFHSILRQEVAFFDRTTSGELASRLNSDCGEMAGDLTWFFRFSIESIVRITGIATYMLIRCPFLGGCALTVIPIVATVNKVYGNWLNKNAMQVQDALAAANDVAQEAFACVRTVIAFASENQEHQKYKERIDLQYRLQVRQLFMTGVYYMIISTFLINTLVQSTLLFIGTWLIQHGRLTAEVLLAFMLYQGQLQSETMNLFQSFTSLVKMSGAGDKVFSLLDRSPLPPGTGSTAVTATEMTEIDNQSPDHRGRTPCSIEIKNLHFYYPTRPDHVVLRDFSLDITQGKTVALVGSSGCGKSTVIGLLQRFYDPIGGSILIDGEDLRNLDIKHHRRRISIVSQENVLFRGSIEENIKYGCPSNASQEDVIAAARLANAHNFVTDFPSGYSTDVGERGVQLSGGQKQRIAIARAIIKKPALLLLDEATSALDNESEQLVQEALDGLLNRNKDMTTVIVAHRLRTVRNADTIVYMEQGRVAEMGTHDELLKLSEGHYRKMVERAGEDGQLPDRWCNSIARR